MSFLDRIRENNVWNPAGFRWWVVDGCRVGRIRHGLVPRLAAFRDIFVVESDAVHLSPALETFAARSAALDEVLKALEAEGIVQGRRNEYYPVTRTFSEPPFLQMERAGVPHFGVRAFGIHMNGYVRRPDGIHMWIGRRAKNKSTYPGMLDNTVAGGQPIGISLRDNLIKECQEEANIPKAMAERAVAVGCITYTVEAADGLKPDVQFCYDLELPDGFTPTNTDGELEEFYLWPIARVAKTVEETQEFKFNCNLVIIDFLLRHGLIPPDHPDYIALNQGLRTKDPSYDSK
jgi:isopentenyldiphosphate isomerase